MIVKKTLPFKTYQNTLETDQTVRREITSIRSFNQELFSTSTPKDCLTSYYDKMKMLNNIECEPFGFSCSTAMNILPDSPPCIPDPSSEVSTSVW